MLVFTCSAAIREVEKVFELKYNVDGCSWLLYKIYKRNMQNVVDNMVK